MHNNSYPDNIVRKFVRDRYFYCLDKLNNNNTLNNRIHSNDTASTPKKMYLRLPYISILYWYLSKRLHAFGISALPKINYGVSKIVIRVKENWIMSFIRWAVCTGCDCSYVGHSKRSLGTVGRR